jgi:tRNA-dihydrouridine synthase
LHGNGDVFSYANGITKIAETGVDGVMVGRGIFQNPWFFNPEKQKLQNKNVLTNSFNTPGFLKIPGRGRKISTY